MPNEDPLEWLKKHPLFKKQVEAAKIKKEAVRLKKELQKIESEKRKIEKEEEVLEKKEEVLEKKEEELEKKEEKLQLMINTTIKKSKKATSTSKKEKWVNPKNTISKRTEKYHYKGGKRRTKKARKSKKNYWFF